MQTECVYINRRLRLVLEVVHKLVYLRKDNCRTAKTDKLESGKFECTFPLKNLEHITMSKVIIIFPSIIE